MNGSIYTQIARNAIQEHYEGTSIDRDFYLSTYPELSQEKASFVTLTLNNRLRGCIGSIIAHQSLLDDLISNARSAAFHDPRFPPLSKEEFSQLSIEVSLLTHPEPVEYGDRVDLARIIRPYVDGVILRLGKYQATFLPQVWDELSDFESFFSHLGMKAGIGNDPLSYHPEIYTYQVQKYEEQSHA
ncbi:MAG: AmmeMemoRadiSam system protein A [Sulfuricurvum sp.]|uniref:AmmeMemoRadiSam system protein A n=1 Tax=Sulfuricurvum sp. TaxID=2025608 RepID=UPI0027375DB4|nr:AmmeMemoRadiSam system protein A [Sulfuricurvum sp.]MDP2851398.1 AmmeMemoRadiSam system protein A [Sulfuricurvum sp.]MDP3292160.1 AmmeMemoRadiSam system protein A [Sulfuricurvum sp.]